MRKPYLIQRATFQDREGKKGIDAIISLDYMGSAEFEWGALPESLGRIRKNIEEYHYHKVEINNKSIMVFTKENIKEVTEILEELRDNKLHLKEFSDFNTYVNPSNYDKEWQSKRPHSTDFWWDIDNDIMFWKDNIGFELKFKVLIQYNPK